MNQLANENEMSLHYFEEQQNIREINQSINSISHTEIVDDDDVNLIINHFDDNQSLTIDRRGCSSYWLEILAIFIGSLVIVLIIVAGIIGIVKGLNVFHLVTSSDSTTIPIGSGIPCRKSSKTDKSCSFDVSHTIELFSIKKPSKIDDLKYSYYSTEYKALSDASIITFTIFKTSKFYLDDISVRGPAEFELINAGNFESGTMNSYCLCGSNLSVGDTIKTSTSAAHSSKYGLEIDISLSSAQLSHVLDTIPGQQYNVSFWIQLPLAANNYFLNVYMSSVVS